MKECKKNLIHVALYCSVVMKIGSSHLFNVQHYLCHENAVQLDHNFTYGNELINAY
jgi:hypothetical protein